MTGLNWNDTLNFLSKLTLRRLWNGCLVWVSYLLSRWSKRPVQWGTPLAISIEPTTACNLRCPECPSGLRSFTRPTGHLKKDLFRHTLDSLYRDLICLIFYFQGEPYLHPQFLEMVRYAADKGLYTITSTNGHFLNDDLARKTVESGLDRLIISIDGATQDVYQKYRVGGNLEAVVQGARNVVKWKKALGSASPHVVFQFLVVRPNEHQLEAVKQLAREIGVDELRLKTAQVYDYVHGNHLIPTLDDYSRYRKGQDGLWKVKNKMLNHCWKLWHACVITWDGMVVPCCFDKDAAHPMGDLRNQGFAEIWHGAPYRKFRAQLLKGRDRIDICSNCTEGCKVWVK